MNQIRALGRQGKVYWLLVIVELASFCFGLVSILSLRPLDCDGLISIVHKLLIFLVRLRFC